MGFTDLELEVLKMFDKEIDKAELTYDDYKYTDFIEKNILFPKDWESRIKARKQRRYKETNKDKIKAYKRAYCEIKKKAAPITMQQSNK